MGSSDSEITRAYADCQRYSDRCDKEFYLREQPLRRVTLSPFLMGQNEVTNREFAGWLNHPEQQLTVESGRMVRDNRTLLVDLATDFSGILYEKDRYVVRPGAADQPVVYVTWYGARAYCRSLGRDLPTEAQWEWAARGANTSRASFPWGSELPTCGGVVMSGPPSGVCSRPRGGPATVGTAPQDRTPQGVFDLGGNVEEWVQDRFLSPYPDCGDCRDPIVRTGTGTSEPEVQVIRGGSHREIPTATRSAGRAQSRADHVDAARGFRCASQPTQ
jgi:serine/threonine-protein kinase